MHETAQGLYHSLENQRWSFLDRGRTSSELTLPYVLPPDGHNYATKYYTPYQGTHSEILTILATDEWTPEEPI